MKEVYISVDIESDGPIPGPNSMLSYGAVAFDADGNQQGTFSENLITLPGATGDKSTMDWWGHPAQQKAWDACRANTQDPAESMRRFVAWVESLPGKAVFVAYPAGYDFTFMYWYMIRFVGHSPFSFSALDIKSFAMSLMGLGFRETTKKTFPKEWFPKGVPHTHVALDDALEQGMLFMNMLRASRERRSRFSQISPAVGRRGNDV